MKPVLFYHNGKIQSEETAVVREYPLVLTVNGRELATLIASPHDLRFLVAGFLRLQGFVSSSSDFHLLSVCEDFGIANVRIRGEVPERLKPTLTSGCGTGITFNLPRPEKEERPPAAAGSFSPAVIFKMMDELARNAENYKSHGGIHSAAVGDETGIILYAEDLGRHNTLDRIAGEALLKGIGLGGKALVTSGRISSELVAKAAHLGISLIASRTSPTDMAVRLCEEAGITLIGYVRANKFTLYSHPERVALPAGGHAVNGVTGVILAGGASSRMGSNKALLPYRGGVFIEAIYRQMKQLFAEVLLVTNSPEQYQFLPCRKVPDLYPGMGALAGLHAGLCQSANPAIFVAACDMPYLNDGLIKQLAAGMQGYDAVIPRTEGGYEPLHAIYGKRCLPAIETCLQQGERKILAFLPQVSVREFSPDEIRLLDPAFSSFSNINTPEEYYQLRETEQKGSGDTRSTAAGEQARQQ